MAGHFDFERHAAEQTLPEQWEWNVHGEGGGGGRGVQRRRCGARGNGSGHGRLRSQREYKLDDYEFFEPDDFALSQRGTRIVRGRSAAVGSGARFAANTGIWMLLF